jgi:hypothetical protein
MAITLTVAGVPFEIPEVGGQGWGEDTTGWMEEVTDQLNKLVTVGDIPSTTFNMSNNVVTPEAVTGLFFDKAYVKGAFVEYNISRSHTIAGPTLVSYVETGLLIINHNPNAALPEDKWTLSRYHSGSSGPTEAEVEFSIEESGNIGQVMYACDNLTGTSPEGKIRFRARVIR